MQDLRDTIQDTLVDRLASEDESALKKYMHIFVGSESIRHLIKYELLTFFLAPFPGAVGLFLRKALYRPLFACLGRGCVFAPYVSLRCPKRIFIGDDVFVDSGAVLDAKGQESRIRLGNKILVGNGSILSCSSATITAGDDVSIGPHCVIRAGMCSVSIGSSVTIGSHSALISGNPGRTQLDIPMKHQVGSTNGIVIGDDVWIGVGAKIIDGVTVGNGSVIGAGAAVVGDVPEFSVVAGVPAKKIGDRRKPG